MDYWWSIKCDHCGREIQAGETYYRVSACRVYEPLPSHVHIPSMRQPQPDPCYCQECADFMNRFGFARFGNADKGQDTPEPEE
jgi:hypothetical protein